MRKQDIKTGVVYAYQRGGWDTPQPLVFLSLDLYRSKRYGSKGDWAMPAASYDQRPKRSEGFSGYDVGYPVVIGDAFHTSADILAAMPDLGTEVITRGLSEAQREAGLRTSILTRMASVTGIYAEVVTEQQARKQRDHEQYQRKEAERERREQRQSVLIARFAALGLTVSRDYRVPELVTLTLDEAENVASLLED